jgi:hypothetical protein
MHCDASVNSTENRTDNASAKRATRITVTLPPDCYETVVRLAKQKRVSTSWVVRDAVDRYLQDDLPLFSKLPK